MQVFKLSDAPLKLQFSVSFKKPKNSSLFQKPLAQLLRFDNQPLFKNDQFDLDNGTPNTKTSKYWIVRHGTKDKDAGLAIAIMLGTLMKNKGYR